MYRVQPAPTLTTLEPEGLLVPWRAAGDMDGHGESDVDVDKRNSDVGYRLGVVLSTVRCARDVAKEKPWPAESCD